MYSVSDALLTKELPKSLKNMLPWLHNKERKLNELYLKYKNNSEGFMELIEDLKELK